MNEYLDTIYSLYPKDIHPSDLNYSSTPENIKQWDIIEAARSDHESNRYFEEFTKALVLRLNCQNAQEFSFRGTFDLCRKAVLFLPNNYHHEEYPCCVINVSIVSKFYSVYFTKFTGVPINTLANGFVNDAQKKLYDGLISIIIKSYYAGYQLFPMEYFKEKVPHILSSKNYNQNATYFDCLMTDDIF